MQKALLSSADKCRHCKHFDYMHLEWVNKLGRDVPIPCMEILKTEYDKSIESIIVLERCECDHYESLDNLKYLEEQHEKRSAQTTKTI